MFFGNIIILTQELLIVGMDPIVDFEVVGTLIYNGLSGFALKKLSST